MNSLDELQSEVAALKVKVQAMEQYLCIEVGHKPADEIPTRRPTLIEIKIETAKWFKLRPHVLCSRTKEDHICFPRQVAMALGWEMTGLSCTDVGEAFSMDHGTVINARRAVRDRCDVYGETRKSVSALRKHILSKVKQ